MWKRLAQRFWICYFVATCDKITIFHSRWYKLIWIFNITVVLHLKWNSFSFVCFLNFTYKLLHSESLHAHRNSKTLTRFKFWRGMISILLLLYLVKINNLVCVSMKIPFQCPFFVLSVQYTWDRYTSICLSIKSPLEITADDYLVEGIKLCGLRCNPSCFYRSTNNGLSFGSPFLWQGWK